MDVRCPSCHSTFTLEQVAEDEALRAKRDAGEDARPLKNHNYFKRVLESVGARPKPAPVARIEHTDRGLSPAANAVTESKTRQAVNRLMRDRRG